MKLPFFTLAGAALIGALAGALPSNAIAGIPLTPPPSTAPAMDLSVELAHPQILAGRKMTTYLKVGLTGQELEASAKRAPVNVTIVIDKSGSMGGDKMIHAREAAKQALDRLGAGDMVSVVAYDDAVSLISPATDLTDRERVKAAIDRIQAGGSTALFSGISKGAEELRRNKRPNQVNRVVLLSDGMANVGPSSPQDLGRLGASLAKEGITVTTLGLGLGYNEDLMTELALRSDGNHAFIENSQNLAGIFQTEFGDILSVVAQRIRVRVQCAEGVRPVRVLGREADIHGQDVELEMNQIYARQHKYLLLEVEIPEGAADTDAPVATAEVTSVNALTGAENRSLTRSVARRVNDPALIANTVNKAVLVEVARAISTEKEALAVKLSDEGRHEEATKAYNAACSWSLSEAKRLASPELEKLGISQQERLQMFNAGGVSANAARKMSKSEDLKNRTQNGLSSRPEAKK
ncbi:VWA domain-containing protein [Verrucomicrobium sp. BvORR106]|uniref:vWA domain-containing protein n=1 Tax=Verrucomicrobium sp. BvORR106 TaxID=1403819 RepID=UPI0009DDA472|nr:VWA domain-containing protein [Verrucomicrobium sp. BvORR106]